MATIRFNWTPANTTTSKLTSGTTRTLQLSSSIRLAHKHQLVSSMTTWFSSLVATIKTRAPWTQLKDSIFRRKRSWGWTWRFHKRSDGSNQWRSQRLKFCWLGDWAVTHKSLMLCSASTSKKNTLSSSLTRLTEQALSITQSCWIRSETCTCS